MFSSLASHAGLPAAEERQAVWISNSTRRAQSAGERSEAWRPSRPSAVDADQPVSEK